MRKGQFVRKKGKMEGLADIYKGLRIVLCIIGRVT